MRASWAVLLCALAAGCSSNPPANSGGGDAVSTVTAVPVPAELVGKWRVEKREGEVSRQMTYHITAGGHIEVDAQVKSPDRTTRDRLTTAVTKVEDDKLTVVDVSRTSAEGIEDILPPERRKSRVVQFRVAGNELHWKRDDGSEWILSRVKE